MKQYLFRCVGLGVAVAALGAAPAAGRARRRRQHHHDHDDIRRHVELHDPALSQPFLAWGDSNWYALAPGEAADDFTGAGWTLTGGAQDRHHHAPGRRHRAVLDLPRGSPATSPTICLTSAYPTARMMIRNVSGSNGGSVGFSVSYAGTSTANAPLQTGTFKTTGASQRRAATGCCPTPPIWTRARPRAGS